MSEPIVTAEQVKDILVHVGAESWNDGIMWSHAGEEDFDFDDIHNLVERLNALLAPVIAERERLARLDELKRVAWKMENGAAAWTEAVSSEAWELEAAASKCPQCQGILVRSGHGPYCPHDTCKWGWETEMDGSPLLPPKVSESQNAAPGKETGK